MVTSVCEHHPGPAIGSKLPALESKKETFTWRNQSPLSQYGMGRPSKLYYAVPFVLAAWVKSRKLQTGKMEYQCRHERKERERERKREKKKCVQESQCIFCLMRAIPGHKPITWPSTFWASVEYTNGLVWCFNTFRFPSVPTAIKTTI